jgi:hypothetical protein
LFRISPLSGVEAVDIFRFSAIYWADEDGPLSYEFGIEQKTGERSLFQPLSLSASVGSILPAGAASNADLITCFARVYDSLGASASVSKPVTVTPAAWGEAAATFSAGLTNAGSLSSVKQAISITSAFLNNINCTGAPACALLNRYSCKATADTCGTCLDDYFGEYGERNSYCGDPAAFAAAEAEAEGNVSCETDAACSVLSYCSQGICQIKPKSCDSGCSDNGLCVLVNNNDGNTVDSCLLNDLSCSAVCACDVGYTGAVCSIEASSNAMSTIVALRTALLARLDEAIAGDDATLDSVPSFIQLLSASSRDAYALSPESLELVLTAASAVMAALSELDVSEADMQGVMASMQAVLSAMTSIESQQRRRRHLLGEDTEFLWRVSSVVDAYGRAIARKWLGAGRTSSSIVLPAFRSRAAMFTGRTAVMVTSPSTGADALLGILPHSASVVDGDNDDTTFRIITTEFKGGTADVSFPHAHSSRFRITAEAANVTKQFRFVLQHSRTPLALSEVYPSNVSYTSDCRQRSLSVFEYVCPGPQGFIIRHQCNGSDSVLSSACPGTQTVSVCAASASGPASAAVCVAETFTETNTTCVCQMTPSASAAASYGARRLAGDALEESGTLEIAAISTETSLQFYATLYESRNINSIEDLGKATIVIIMYAVMWGLGLFISWYLVSNGNPARVDVINGLLQGAKLNAIAQTSESVEKIKTYLNAYIDEIFPSVYHSKPWYDRLVAEVVKNHRFITIFARSGEQKSRFVTTIHLLTIQTMLMFMLAVFYDVQVSLLWAICCYAYVLFYFYL